MRKTALILTLVCLLSSFSSCGMESVIPENSTTFAAFEDNAALYEDCVAILSAAETDCMISKTNFYAPQGSEDFSGLYRQNMEDNSFSVCDEPAILTLFENTNVKIVDYLQKGDLKICVFDMCIPGKNFDYGIYYISEDRPVYFGDTELTLAETGNGFSYEKSASYGSKFIYYTEKITDHYYYYEI